jgi:hypothetical protein
MQDVFSLATVCPEIHGWHVVTKEWAAILNSWNANVNYYNMIEHKDIVSLYKIISHQIETYTLQNYIKCLRSTLKIFKWHHDFSQYFDAF